MILLLLAFRVYSARSTSKASQPCMDLSVPVLARGFAIDLQTQAEGISIILG
jgi:hypothetical protein